ncbi:MAG TPA: FHA domain-containing protein, partial [Kiritimatiellia bacterium]|nr:FHA domain-containing protein [Kiritimatiellia bacterium]
MKLRYTKQDGGAKEFELGERSITVGRSSEADIILLDDKVSRVHCGIRFWDGEFYVKDLKSKNGTFVNGHRVEVAKLTHGDTIRVGSYSFTFEQDTSSMGTTTAIREIGGEMDLGKGYSTLLREIVDDAPEAPKAPPAPPPASYPAPTPPP